MAHSWARNFGVEIECLVNVGYNGWSQIRQKLGRDWVAKSDGSLNQWGVEINTPVLRGAKGLAELKRGVDILVNDFGARVDSSCGLHIHHDVNDLDRGQIGNVLIAYSLCQDLIDKFVAPARRTFGQGPYGVPGPKKPTVDRLKRQKAERFSAFERWYSYDFYKFIYGGIGDAVCVNDEYGTIEIRQHEGTVNYDEIYAWVKFGQQLIHVAKEREWRASARSCAALLERVGVPKRARTTLLEKAGRKTWDRFTWVAEEDEW